MKPCPLPSGLQRGIPFIIQDDWSPEQALAVIELLDDLREVIWGRYQIQLLELMNEQRCTYIESDFGDTEENAPPF